MKKKKTERQDSCRSSVSSRTCPPRKGIFSLFHLHPLFVVVGIWYCIKGELFLFLLSALVAIQHECAHAFAAAKLGYTLNRIILMPYGAVIDGDLKGITFKDEIYVAICGPLCNLCTALFFVAIWWLTPTMYAFTDTACYTSLSIALVNLLPAYPLDGGRIFKCALARGFMKSTAEEEKAERKAEKICKAVTIVFSVVCLGIFVIQCVQRIPNFSILLFGIFLGFGGIGNKEKATYGKIDFSLKKAFLRGVEIRRIAVLESCTIKDALRFFTRGHYLILEVYDEREQKLFEITQNELSELFLQAKTPYTTLNELHALR